MMLQKMLIGVILMGKKRCFFPRHVAIFRFSALGDVAMTVPVVYEVCRACPDVRFTLYTKAAVASLFLYPPANLTIFPVDTHGRYRGLRGLWRLFRGAAAGGRHGGRPAQRLAHPYSRPPFLVGRCPSGRTRQGSCRQAPPDGAGEVAAVAAPAHLVRPLPGGLPAWGLKHPAPLPRSLTPTTNLCRCPPT